MLLCVVAKRKAKQDGNMKDSKRGKGMEKGEKHVVYVKKDD